MVLLFLLKETPNSIYILGLFYFAGSLVGGGIEEFEAVETLSELGAALVALKHSRGAEAEADRLATEKLRANRRTVQGMIDFFEHLDENYGLGAAEKAISWANTHPLTRDRLEFLREARSEETFAPHPWVDENHWKSLRELR